MADQVAQQQEEMESASAKGSRKHLWHGLLFLIAGVFMLGSYVTFGAPPPPPSMPAPASFSTPTARTVS